MLNTNDFEETQVDSMVSPRLAIDPSHKARIEPEEKKAQQAAPVQAAASQGIDAALIKEIWPYIRSKERIPGPGMIANEGNELAQELRQEITNSLGTIEASISEVKAKKADVVADA